ncbi:hypothetical protein [Nocardioides sp. CFH 31398]|uniref:hypothetical protein n=1 Tax=Nocardioides sp. CFH 31398 TaxID=2919579 RepID=UPI001F05C77F|nr:hypothetical protein [Nocardioides sp. CFH 31398]MCH1865112.1 hypothetical protein [Nocardioides sp. CFH 31398]
MTVAHWFGLTLAAMMLAFGGVAALQGLGYVGGPLADSRGAAGFGSALAGLGVALGIVVLQNRR